MDYVKYNFWYLIKRLAFCIYFKKDSIESLEAIADSNLEKRLEINSQN